MSNTHVIYFMLQYIATLNVLFIVARQSDSAVPESNHCALQKQW